MPADLPDLLARVEAATGADRELDAEIEAAVFGGTASHLTGLRPHRSYGAGTVFTTVRPDCILIGDTYHSEPLTASLDAALALCERVLPEWRMAFTDEAGDVYWVLSEPVMYGKSVIARHADRALALLAAMLRALIAKGSPDAG